MSELDIYAGNEMSYRDYYLSHYGVKGMKWGVRKARTGVGNAYQNHKKKRANKRAEAELVAKKRDYYNNRAPGYDDKSLNRDFRFYGYNGIGEINRKMHDGMPYRDAKRAVFKESLTQGATAVATVAGLRAGAAAVSYLSSPAGQKTVLAGVTAAGKLFRDTGIDSDKAIGYAKLAKKSARGVYKITNAR